ARRVRCDQDGYLYVRSIKNQGEVAGAADSGFQVLGIRRDDDDDVIAGVVNGDYTYLATNAIGYLRVTLQSPITSTYVQVTTTTPTQIVPAPGAGKRLYITGLRIQQEGTTATLASYLDGSTLLGRVFLATNQGVGMDRAFVYPLRLSFNSPLNVALSTASTVGVTAEYYTASE
ncbi:MAG: hypothetical protein V2G41_09790, partial [bacterium JZ-2024 1]